MRKQRPTLARRDGEFKPQYAQHTHAPPWPEQTPGSTWGTACRTPTRSASCPWSPARCRSGLDTCLRPQAACNEHITKHSSASFWKVARSNNERAPEDGKGFDASSQRPTARSKKARVLQVLSVPTTSSGLRVYSTAWIRSSVSRIGAMNIWCPTGVGGVGTRQCSGYQPM